MPDNTEMPSGVMPKLIALTVQERILVAISPYGKMSENFVAPLGVTQNGIATALGISRAHVATDLKKLMGKGYVEESLRHVEGKPRQLVVYFPTPTGIQKVEAMRASFKVPVETLVFAPCTKIIRRRELAEDIHDMRERLDRMEARARAEGWL